MFNEVNTEFKKTELNISLGQTKIICQNATQISIENQIKLNKIK